MSPILTSGLVLKSGGSHNGLCFCGGKIEPKVTTFTYENGEEVILIKNVPAKICSRCGEKTFSPEITDEILKFAKHMFKLVKTMEISFFDFLEKEAV